MKKTSKMVCSNNCCKIEFSIHPIVVTMRSVVQNILLKFNPNIEVKCHCKAGMYQVKNKTTNEIEIIDFSAPISELYQIIDAIVKRQFLTDHDFMEHSNYGKRSLEYNEDTDDAESKRR